MADDFSFRQRFEVARGGHLPIADETLSLYESGPVSIELRSDEEKPMTESVLLSIRGKGFPTEDEARAAGNHWRGVMQRALAGVCVGANFGLRNPNMGGFSDELLKQMKVETGQTIYRDSWDVLVYPTYPPARFSSTAAEGQVSPPITAVMASIASSNASVDAPNEVAFDLLTAAMRSGHIADARLVLLVMAVECLVERVQRPQATREHIDELVAATLENDSLDPEERESLANALRGLRMESTRRAVKALSATLLPENYGEEPTSLIQEAFGMRNALVHGRSRPDLERVRYVGANLERMVADLIAGPSVTEAVRQARLDLK